MLKKIQNYLFPQSAAVRMTPLESRIQSLHMAFKIAEILDESTPNDAPTALFAQNKSDIMAQESLEPAYDPALHGDDINDTPYYWLDPVTDRATLDSFLAFRKTVKSIQPDNLTMNQVWNIGPGQGTRSMKIRQH